MLHTSGVEAARPSQNFDQRKVGISNGFKARLKSLRSGKHMGMVDVVATFLG